MFSMPTYGGSSSQDINKQGQGGVDFQYGPFKAKTDHTSTAMILGVVALIGVGGFVLVYSLRPSNLIKGLMPDLGGLLGGGGSQQSDTKGGGGGLLGGSGGIGGIISNLPIIGGLFGGK